MPSWRRSQVTVIPQCATSTMFTTLNFGIPPGRAFSFVVQLHHSYRDADLRATSCGHRHGQVAIGLSTNTQRTSGKRSPRCLQRHAQCSMVTGQSSLCDSFCAFNSFGSAGASPSIWHRGHFFRGLGRPDSAYSLRQFSVGTLQSGFGQRMFSVVFPFSHSTSVLRSWQSHSARPSMHQASAA